MLIPTAPKIMQLSRGRKALSFAVYFELEPGVFFVVTGFRVMGGMILPPSHKFGKPPYEKFSPSAYLSLKQAVRLYQALKATGWPELNETEPLLDWELAVAPLLISYDEIALRFPEVGKHIVAQREELESAVEAAV